MDEKAFMNLNQDQIGINVSALQASVFNWQCSSGWTCVQGWKGTMYCHVVSSLCSFA